MKFIWIILILVFTSCKTLFPDYNSMYWGELQSSQNYLYTHPDLQSVVDGELDSGSILLIGTSKGDFTTVYLQDPYKTNKKKKYYLHKAKYVKNSLYSSGNSEKLNKSTIEISRSYVTGEKGGCYYINNNGNRIYVNKSLCSSYRNVSENANSASSNTSSTGGSNYVKGHYRKTKSGKTVYVKPHVRKKN